MIRSRSTIVSHSIKIIIFFMFKSYLIKINNNFTFDQDQL